MKIPRFQFSLRVLIVATILLGLLAGFFVKSYLYYRGVSRLKYVRNLTQKLVELEVSQLEFDLRKQGIQAAHGCNIGSSGGNFHVEYTCFDNSGPKPKYYFQIKIRGKRIGNTFQPLQIQYEGLPEAEPYFEPILQNLSANEIRYDLKRAKLDPDAKSK